MPRGNPPYQLDTLVYYFRGARFANVAVKLRHPDVPAVQADCDRYIAQMDHYIEAVTATFKLRREREAGGTGG